ncbi:MAG: hypothetical protein AAFY78_07670 [Cyanobacteria bacterium J06648_16]
MTKPCRVLQIVPRLSPDVDGVGDYALQLAQQLSRQHQIASEFLVFRPSRRTTQQVAGFPVHRLTEHTIDGLLACVPKAIDTVLLQYSNYPYLRGKLDAPGWLVAGLAAFKQRGVRVVVMFHELPTLRYRRIRCPNPIQRQVSRRLAQVADAVVTNNTAFQQTLSTWVTGSVRCLPNFSTVGESAGGKPLCDRTRALVVFGSSDRSRAYRNNLSTLQTLCGQLGIQTLYDVGRPLDETLEEVASHLQIRLIRTGFLPAEQVSQLMEESFAGLFDYRRFPNNLAKSTVYAAYCAHGLLPINNQQSLRPQDGVVSGRHYLSTAELTALHLHTPDLLTSLQIVATNAHQQYQTRTLAICAQAFATLLSPETIAVSTLPPTHTLVRQYE